jgi:hypothetical protein
MTILGILKNGEIYEFMKKYGNRKISISKKNYGGSK